MSSLISSLTILFLVVVLLVNFSLAVFVFRINSKSATNKIFAVLGFVLTIWAITQFISLQPFSSDSSIFWVRISSFWAIPITPLFLLLSHTLPSEKIVMRKKRFILLIFSTVFVMLITLSPLVFSYVEIKNGVVSPVPGPAVPVFPLFIIINAVLLVYVFYTRIRLAEGILKQQLIFVMLGIFLMLGFIILTIVLPVTVFQIVTFVPLFPVYTLFFTGLTTYAIVKHELFNLKVIATEAITIFLWVILLAKLFVSQSASEFVLDTLILLAVIVTGTLLIRSVMNEVKQREQLELLNQKLKELDKQKDEFISVAAHELRAPLSAVKGYLSMAIEGDGGELPDLAKQFLSDGFDASERMVRLIANLLNVGRIEENRLVYQMGNVNMSKVVKTVFKEFEKDAGTKKLKLSIDIPENIKDGVYVDSDRIHEVVGNFVSNGIKYTDVGEIVIKLTNPSDGWVRVEVTDTGPGMPADEKKNLFQKFYRGESRAHAVSGTGLGLYVARLLVEHFKGKIGVISEEGKGSTFWFELPTLG